MGKSTTYFIAPTIYETFTRLGFVLFCWMIYCLVTVVLNDLESRIEDDVMKLQPFTDNCINDEGSLSYIEAPLFVDVYCDKINGVKSRFISTYNSSPYTIQLVNKISFGLFEIDKKTTDEHYWQ